MLSMLEELYCGNVGFDSKQYRPNSPFSKAAHKSWDYREKLLETLNESEKELFEQYCEERGTIESITRYDTYLESLQFGILLMMEIFMDSGYCTKEDCMTENHE